MWDASNTSLREAIVYNNEQYINFLKSKEGKALSFLWADNLLGRRKKMLFTNEGKSMKMVTFRNSVSRLIFSNDSTLLAVGCSKKNGLFIYDAETFTGKTGYLQGSVSALCAAHHTPAFVVGANKSHFLPEFSNLVLIHQGKTTCLPGHGEDSIVSVEFSPDDTRLLTLSEVSNGYCLKLWDTSDFNAIECVYEDQGTGIHVQKAFFICDGQRIVTVEKDGTFFLSDGLRGEDIGVPSRWNRSIDHDQKSNKVPIFIWSNKNKLLISSLDDTIEIHTSEKGKQIGRIVCGTKPIGMGLTADENSIVFMSTHNKAYRFPLYEDQELKSVDFIENQADLLQLYDMLNMSKKHKQSNRERCAYKMKKFILAMQSYIQECNLTSEK
jgi:WD40 repeat protein